MNNQHPILRWFVRICGVRNHRPHTRQPVVQSLRDYPPAFIPPLPNDKTSDSWYCKRDNRRDVEPNKSITQIPDAINDTKYPVPGWGTGTHSKIKMMKLNLLKKDYSVEVGWP